MKKAKLLILGFENLQYHHLQGMDLKGLETCGAVHFYPVHAHASEPLEVWKEQLTGLDYTSPDGFKRKYFWEYLEENNYKKAFIRNIGGEQHLAEDIRKEMFSVFNEFTKIQFREPADVAIFKIEFLAKSYNETLYGWFDEFVTAVIQAKVAECHVILSDNKDGVFGIAGNEMLSSVLRNHGHIKGVDVLDFLCAVMCIEKPQEGQKWLTNAATL